MPPLPPSSTSSSSDDFPYPQPHTPPEYSCSSIHIPIQHKGIMAGYHHHEGEEEEVRGRNSYSLERFLQEPGSPSTTGGGAGGGGAGVNGKYGTMSPGSSIQGYTGLTGNGRRPRLLLMGQRRSGKSSISSVVFHKMPPTETLFLESTTRIQKDPIHSFMDFQVWDFPGQLNFLDPTFDFDHIFGELGALIWVIDAQDEYLDPLSRLHATIIAIQRSYPAINIEVFIHKVDGLSDEYKLDTQRDIMQRTQDELSDNGLDNVQVSYHLTSIYDHSVFEAFSKVIQKLIPQLETLENLLNVLCSNSGIEKAFLFDVLSKIYIATDSSPVDVQSYEICSDYIDVIVDVSEIYGYDRKQPAEITDAPHVPGAEDDEEQTAEASSIIRLQNGMVLYLREINKYLALICLMRKEGIEKKGLVDFNVQVFQNALQRVFEVGR